MVTMTNRIKSYGAMMPMDLLERLPNPQIGIQFFGKAT